MRSYFTDERRQFLRFAVEIFLCSVFIALFISMIAIISYNPSSYYNFAQKDSRLATAPSPRLVILGGSGAALNIDSKVLQEKTNYNVVNMASSAGLGLRFMFTSVEDRLKKDDVVVYVMEPSVIQQLLYPDGASLLVTIHPSPWYLPYAFSPLDIDTLHSWTDALRKAPSIFQQKLTAIYTLKIESLWHPHVPTLSEKLYTAENFTVYGDTDATVVGSTYLSLEKLTNSDIGRISEREANKKTLALLKQKIDLLESRDIRVLILWPPYAKLFVDRDAKLIEKRVEEIKSVIGSDRFVGTATSFLMPNDFFYDGSSHLNLLGKTLYSKELLPFLLQRLNEK